MRPMAEYVDALARHLAGLLETGSVIESLLPRGKKAQARLQGLIASGVLRYERFGSGRRLLLCHRETLQAFIDRHYPAGLTVAEGAGVARVDAVAYRRSSKHARRGEVEGVLLRGFGDTHLTAESSARLDVAMLTEQAGVAAIALGDNRPRWRARGHLVTVENATVFYEIEQVLEDADLAVYTQGAISERLLGWLAEQARGGCRLTHAGDYDPIGLNEYERLLAAGIGAHLLMPDNLERLFGRYSSAALLTRKKNSQALLRRLRVSEDPSTRRVVALIERNNAGLEQEALLIDRCHSSGGG